MLSRIHQSRVHVKIFVYVIAFALCLVSFCTDTPICHADEQEIVFSGTEQERIEFVHMLFAKLTYDYMDGYEGQCVAAYVNDHPELYDGEIWENSGITYTQLYDSIVGEWEIYKIYNNNKTTGLYAAAFKKDNQVILAFRGSEMFTDAFALDESNDWTGTDFRFALLNELSGQFENADNCYKSLLRKLKIDGVDADITLTGHSLGGALVTYESLVTGVYGYSFDGACGHVIDLVYFYQYLNIDTFSGVDQIQFCNYTDAEGYPVADIIQHTYAEDMFQIDRKTFLEGLNENTLIPQIAAAGSHIVWSDLAYEGNCVYFTEEIGVNEQGYTYAPEEKTTFDITKNILEAGTEAFDGGLPWGQAVSNLNYEYMLGALSGAVKDGRVVLGTTGNDTLCAYDGIGVNGAFAVNTVLYGGGGDDILIGYTADDVLVAGEGNDILEGNLGNDTYLIDAASEQNIVIRDVGGERTTIILRGFNFNKADNLKWNEEGKIEFGNGQEITLDVSQDAVQIVFYGYDAGRMKLLGTFADVSGNLSDYSTENDGVMDDSSEEKYVVLLEGRGSFDIYDENGQTYSVNNMEAASFQDVEKDFGKAYINGTNGNESILLIFNREYEVYVTNEDARVNMALGRYTDSEGMVACERKYNRNFDHYKVLFSDMELDDGTQGDITWQDAVYSGLGILQDMFR